MIISRLTFVWDSRATVSMINRNQIKHYELKVGSNKVEYSIVTGL